MTTFGVIPGSTYLLKEPFHYNSYSQSFQVTGKIWWIYRHFQEDHSSILICAEQKSTSHFHRIRVGRQELWNHFEELNRRVLKPNRQLTVGSKWRHSIPFLCEETTITEMDMNWGTATIRRPIEIPRPDSWYDSEYRIHHSDLLLNFDPCKE